MFVSITATFCHLVAAAASAGHVELCEQVTITDSNQDEALSMSDCYKEDHFVKFMQEHPIYRNWRLANFGCTVGNRQPLDNKHDKA